MALTVVPGPLPVEDGERLHVERDLAAFVNGTDVSNIGRPQVRNTDTLDFVTSATDPPEENERGRSTIWFQRGEGKFWSWQIDPTGPTSARWVQISDRREKLVHTRQGVSAGQLMWLGPESEQLSIEEARFGRFPLTLEAESDSAAATRISYVPPFVVAVEDGDAGSFVRAVEVGFVTARIDSGSSVPGLVGKVQPDDNPRLQYLPAGWDDSANDQVGLGYASQSLAETTQDQQITVFFLGDGTNLTI